MTSRDEMREAFEKAMIATFGSSPSEVVFARLENGMYNSDWMDTAYRVWQACRASMGDVVRRSDVAELVAALELSQTSIRQLRDQGAPCAYWDDVEAKNLKSLSKLKLTQPEQPK